MTPAQEPQREYTFACECCQNKCRVVSYNAIPPDCGCLINSDIGAIWNTRPHTTAPDPTKYCVNMGRICLWWDGTECSYSTKEQGESDCVEWLKEHDAAIARTATLKTLEATKQLRDAAIRDYERLQDKEILGMASAYTKVLKLLGGNE